MKFIRELIQMLRSKKVRYSTLEPPSPFMNLGVMRNKTFCWRVDIKQKGDHFITTEYWLGGNWSEDIYR